MDAGQLYRCVHIFLFFIISKKAPRHRVDEEKEKEAREKTSFEAEKRSVQSF